MSGGGGVDRPVTAVAGTNIALVKYWGKRDAALNLPAAGSLSLTLGGLGTRTTVRFADGLDGDRVTLDGAPADPRAAARVSAFLDRVRARAGVRRAAEVVSENNIPTAAGLASSASGFAALAVAAARAAGLDLSAAELSELARLGSGSAARSIFGGFAEMAPGERPDGRDAVAAPVAAPAFDVRLVVAVTSADKKALGSTEAMQHTARTSPYYAAWLASVPGDLGEARAAIAARDLARLGAVAERSAMRMHAAALAADPAVVYWNGATVAALHAVRALRARGVGAYFTIDAGPHVKALCAPADAGAVAEALAAVPGVLRTLVAEPGPGARVVEAAER
jgi:diphosphomevalonate decarboxylase